MTSGQQADLDVLLAERRIERLLVACCQGIDRRDWATVRACYHDNALDSHGAFVGGADELVEWLRRRHEFVLSSRHLLTNVSIRFSDDRRHARAESYCLSQQIVNPANGDPFAGEGDSPVFMTVACRYVDTLEDRPATGWRIRRRDVVFDWTRRENTDAFLPLDPMWTQSRRDRTDLIYGPWLADRSEANERAMTDTSRCDPRSRRQKET